MTGRGVRGLDLTGMKVSPDGGSRSVAARLLDQPVRQALCFCDRERPVPWPISPELLMRPTTFRALLLLALFGAVAPAFAPAALGCPFCESEIGKQVEAGIFNDDFGTNALLTLLPFPILLGIVALIHFGLPGPRGKTNPGPVSPRNEVGAPASLTRESST